MKINFYQYFSPMKIYIECRTMKLHFQYAKVPEIKLCRNEYFYKQKCNCSYMRISILYYMRGSIKALTLVNSKIIIVLSMW